jgi:hypothetical protein
MNFCDVDETKIQRRHVCWCRRRRTINGGVGSPREKPVRWPRLGGCAILAQRWRPTRRRPRRTRHNSIKSFILICLSRACPDGEIGRRSGLKIRRPQGRGGSSPPLGTKNKTIKINNLQRHEPLTTGRRLRCPNNSGAGSGAGFYLVCYLRPRRTKNHAKKSGSQRARSFREGAWLWHLVGSLLHLYGSVFTLTRPRMEVTGRFRLTKPASRHFRNSCSPTA